MINFKNLIISTVLLSGYLLAVDTNILDLNQYLMSAVEIGNLQDVQSAVKSGADVNFKDKYGLSVLDRAILSYPVIEKDNENLKLKYPATIEQIENYKKIIEFLLASKAEVNRPGFTPLMLAASCPYTIYAMLASTVKPSNFENLKTNNAVPADFSWLITLLLKYNAHVDATLDDDNNDADNDEDSYESVEQTEENSVNSGINIDDTSGFTALMFACLCGNAANAEVLLAAGADMHKATSAGYTPMVVAVLNGHIEIVKLLLTKICCAVEAQEAIETVVKMSRELDFERSVKSCSYLDNCNVQRCLKLLEEYCA